jgi:hypothetical protein
LPEVIRPKILGEAPHGAVHIPAHKVRRAAGAARLAGGWRGWTYRMSGVHWFGPLSAGSK